MAEIIQFGSTDPKPPIKGGYIVTIVGHPFILNDKAQAVQLSVQVLIEDLDALIQKYRDDGGVWTEEKALRRHFLPWPFAHVHVFRHSADPENVDHPLVSP